MPRPLVPWRSQSEYVKKLTKPLPDCAGLPSASVLGRLSTKEQTRQIAIQELIHTEEQYMVDLTNVTQVNSLHFFKH